MRSLKTVLPMLLVSLYTVLTSPLAVAAGVTVFAAASLKEAMDDQARQFESKTGEKVVVSYAGSNVLAKQIESGAPADVFISADVDWMDFVEQRRLLRPGSRVNILRNALVLIAPASSTSHVEIGPGFGLAAALGGDRLAMANPDSVPAGKYGKAALESLGVWAAVEGKVARTENVRGALALVSRGEAPFGIVYKTDAMADKGVKVVGAFPPGSYPPVIYPAALIATSASSATLSRSLLEYLRSGPAARVWEKYGFDVFQ